jgi:hypothetical protein
MPALTNARNTAERVLMIRNLPLAANARVFQGGIVAVHVSGGSAAFAQAGITATTLRGVGVALATVDNTGGAAGAKQAEVKRGCHRFTNSAAGDLITRADIGSDCFIVDDQTVAKTNGTNTRSVAGRVADVDADGVWVDFVY